MTLLRWLTIAVCSALAACGGQSPAAPANPIASPTSLHLTAIWSQSVPGDRQPLYVVAVFADGSYVEGPKGVTWTSSDPRVGSMSGNFFTANAAGDVDVRASYLGVTSSIHLTIAAANDLREVRLTGEVDNGRPPLSSFQLIPGRFRSIHAIAVFPDGSEQDVTALVEWRSSDSGVAELSSGLLTGVRPGLTTVSATYHGRTATVDVTIAPTHPGQDALESLAGGHAGNRPGDVMTISETLSYNLVSAPSGRITMLMTDQDGALVGSTPPAGVDVARGAGAVTVSDTFVIPTGAKMLCVEIRLVLNGSTRPPVTTGRRCAIGILQS